MDASELKEILDQHKLWIENNGRQGERADLRGANLKDANLKDANLSGANLSFANLKDANLSFANLYGADLTGAYLQGANLSGATLTGANLTGAILHGANLYGANLTGAILHGANLTGAILHGAYLWGANLKDAILPDISWVVPCCLVQLNNILYGFYLVKENKSDNFIQDSIGFIIENNREEKTFDILAGDRVIRNIPDWIKYSGLKQIE